MDFAVIKAAFSGENINKMGLKCADVGWLDPATYGDVFPLCKDKAELMTNAYSDSSVCGSVAMPNNPNSAAASTSSWLMLAVTMLCAHLAALD